MKFEQHKLIQRKQPILCVLLFLTYFAKAQDDSSFKERKFSYHFQTTVISQGTNRFKSPYVGDNSFLPTEPTRSSITATAFLAYKPARNTYIVFNPEIAGGRGLSATTGMAGFPNGEIYRIGDPKLQPFIARLYIEKRFPLSNIKAKVWDEANQIQEKANEAYFSVLVGKFSITDFFDDLPTSNDPRTQYLNWALMGSGAWDYPANTRGYTMGAVFQYIQKTWALKAAITTVPTEANGPTLQFKPGKAMGTVIEYSHETIFNNLKGGKTSLHAGIFYNNARMGNYNQSIKNAGSTIPDITDSRKYGRVKAGIYAGLNTDYSHIHHFLNASWSDGKNETWAFTEIDRSITAGIQFDGYYWKRNNDKFAIAFIANGLSEPHRKYLAAGGIGFMVGDGKLNYAPEQIFEAYYFFQVYKGISLTPDYQFAINPAYNKDRGPANIYAIRLHIEL